VTAGSDTPKLGVWPVAARLAVLLGAGAVMWATDRYGSQGSGAVAALGLLLLGGDLIAQLLEPIGLPHLTGYLAAGMLAGPHVLRLISEQTVGELQTVNGLALALIAFSAGAELTAEMLRTGLRRLSVAVAAQSVLLLILLAGVFDVARPLMPFLAGRPQATVLGLALLWGVISDVKSPSAVLGVLAETQAKGPLTTYAIAMVVVLDVVVLVLFQLVLLVSKVLIDPAASFAVGQLVEVGRELLSSVALGTTLGLATGLYLAVVNRGVILFLIALGFAAAQLDRYFGYDAMLVFATAGFVVQNLTRQGERLLHAIRRSGSVVYVVFFAGAGAHLDLGVLRELWPVALLLAGTRGAATVAAAAGASKLSGDSPAIQRWGWAPLISQAGVALGIAVAADAAFPGLGAGFRSLAIAVVGLNEAVGPILFKVALSRAGEIGRALRTVDSEPRQLVSAAAGQAGVPE
jgi:Kef-type K+ transport system membrane component KefB